MKKLFLAVAVLATSFFTANAVVIYDGTTYAVDQTGLTAVTGPATTLPTANLTLTVNGTDAQFTTVAAPATETDTYVQFPNGLTLYSGVGTAALKKFFKISASGNLQHEGKLCRFTITGLTAGDVITFTDNGGTGAVCDAVGISEGASITLTASAATSVTATGSEISLTTTTTGKCRISKIERTTSGSNDAISSSLLSKVADELVNPTNLEVEVYSVSGVKVLTSSAASISVSGLANGAYIAKTAEGTLKFVK